MVTLELERKILNSAQHPANYHLCGSISCYIRQQVLTASDHALLPVLASLNSARKSGWNGTSPIHPLPVHRISYTPIACAPHLLHAHRLCTASPAHTSPVLRISYALDRFCETIPASCFNPPRHIISFEHHPRIASVDLTRSLFVVSNPCFQGCYS